eukprot:g14888.t1
MLQFQNVRRPTARRTFGTSVVGKAKFLQRQKNFERDLQEAEEENMAAKTAIRTQHKELESWYPGFQLYQDSFESVDDAAPEVAMAEDFKRLLAALPPDKRKVIGQDLMGLIDGDEVEKISDAPFNMEEKAQEIAEIERLQCELQAQEETKAVAAEIIDCP